MALISMIQHWKIILSLLVIFSAGVFVGHQWGVQTHSDHDRHHDRRQGFQEKVIGDLTERLNLSQEQIEAIRPIVQEMEDKLKLVRNETFELTKNVINQMNAKIAEKLDPEQKTLYEAWHEEQKLKWKDRSSGKKGDKAELIGLPTACTQSRC